MLRKKHLASLACAIALAGATTGAAFAGEVTGNGKDTAGPSHASSICAFSGQNDDPDAEAPEGGRVQSFGQLVRGGFIDPTAFNPGSPEGGCRGN
jgi:hypothetical protein